GGVLPAVDPAAAAAAGAAGGAAAAPANQAANVPHVLSPTQVQAALAQIRAAAEVSDWGVGVFSSEVPPRGVGGTRKKLNNDKSKCHTSGVLTTRVVPSVPKVQFLGKLKIILPRITAQLMQDSRQTVFTSQFKLQKVRAGSPPEWGARTVPMSQ
ncbi:hypothetical protein FOZ63_010370, partial [Perkinsus olseni]